MPTYYSSNADGDLDKVYLHNYEEYLVVDALVTSGRLWSWGANDYGGLGDNTTTIKSSPVQTVAGGTNWSQVSCGEFFSSGIKSDGTLWCWGDGIEGQMGDNGTTDRSSPVQTVATGTNWKQVSCGQFHVGAVKTDGTLWLWGYNVNGELGNNSSVGKSSPVQTVSTGTDWRLVSCGYLHTAAIKTDDSLWLWGDNVYGQLGNNSNGTDISSPIQTISGGTNWKTVSVGREFTSAIKTDGTLWSWGINTYGQLGDNSRTSRSSPVQTVAGGTNWKQVSCGHYHIAAIKTDGTLWLWGRNNFGLLGDNTSTDKSSPVQTVSGGTNWKQVSCGLNHTAGIKTDNSLWLWGRNQTGQLGDNTSTDKSSPVQTIIGGTNWRLVACGTQFSAATTL